MNLRVVTYNVLDGGVGREDLILAVLGAISADVVVLQEVFTDQFVRHLGDSLGMHSFLATANSKYHLAVLSRWPFAARNSYHPFPPFQQTVLEAAIECPNGQTLNVFGVLFGASNGQTIRRVFCLATSTRRRPETPLRFTGSVR